MIKAVSLLFRGEENNFCSVFPGGQTLIFKNTIEDKENWQTFNQTHQEKKNQVNKIRN